MLAYIYGTYLAVSVAMALWAGHALHQSGRVFLLETYKGNEAQADALNRLLLVGFYLFGFGFICAALNFGTRPETLNDGIEFLSSRLGFTIIGLGVMHFIGVITRVVMRP